MFINFNAFEFGNIGACGDDNVFGVDHFIAHLHFACALYFAVATDHINFVFLQQKINALGVAINGLLFEVHHFREIDFGLRDDAHLGE